MSKINSLKRPHRIFREKRYLEEQYLERKRSARDIAMEHSVTDGSIFHWLRRHGIPRRDTSESRKIKYWRGPAKTKARNPNWRPPTSEEMREYLHLLSLACPEIREQYRETQRRAAVRNKDSIKESQRRHNAKFHSLIRERGRVHDKNRQPQRTECTRNRRRTDLNFRLAGSLRGRVGAALRGKNKSASTLKLLGCSIESFKLYLESLWEQGMSWSNYGRYPGWQIDHIMPCAIFDLTKPEHQRRCFHFSNCHPMWAEKNYEKSAKIVTNQFNLL